MYGSPRADRTRYPVGFQLLRVVGARVPANARVTDWVPALEADWMTDLAVIHGGMARS